MKKETYIKILALILLVMWIPVALDKFWDLPSFHRTLLRQPFPDSWADVLYWLLPIIELACALLLAGGAMDNPKTNTYRKAGFALSSILMLGFTLFILFGVLGWYEKRPCGCGSVISGLSWDQHLWFNLGFLLISVAGWWLGRDLASGRPEGFGGSGHSVPSEPPAADAVRLTLLLLAFRRSCRLRYPRKFALFPGRPVG